MIIDIKGNYRFTQNDKIILEGHNLITLLGESFFLNRWINNEFDPLHLIVLGKGTGRPRKTDTQLGKLSVTKECTANVDLVKKELNLTCDFNASEVIDTTEIGVTNGDILISHDIYEKISSELLREDTTSTIHLDYTFNLITGGIRSKWTQSNENPNVYYIREPSNVVGVIENNTGSGYTRKSSVEELKNNPGTYYYNTNSKNLYIHNTRSNDPNNDEIIVQTR